MRTTITLDADAAALIQKAMRERGLTFREVVNAAVRTALGTSRSAEQFRTPTFSMGFTPTVPWDKALRLAAELEDEELIRKLAERR